MIHFFETQVKFSFMSSLYKSLKILEKDRFGLMNLFVPAFLTNGLHK